MPCSSSSQTETASGVAIMLESAAASPSSRHCGTGPLRVRRHQGQIVRSKLSNFSASDPLPRPAGLQKPWHRNAARIVGTSGERLGLRRNVRGISPGPGVPPTHVRQEAREGDRRSSSLGTPSHPPRRSRVHPLRHPAQRAGVAQAQPTRARPSPTASASHAAEQSSSTWVTSRASPATA